MKDESILGVRGVDKTTARFRRLLFDMARRNGWSVDAIAAVISNESGFNATAKNPHATASGLIQMIDSTAKAVGIAGGAAELRRMSGEDQVPYIETFYKAAFRNRAVIRPVDYYLAGWGSGIGQPSSYVLASATDEKKYSGGTKNLYDLNSGLDRDRDGRITVSDLENLVNSIMAAAKGRRIPLVEAGSPSQSGEQSEASSVSVPQPTFDYAAEIRRDTANYLDFSRSVKLFQAEHGLEQDGVVGPKTWAVVMGLVGGKK